MTRKMIIFLVSALLGSPLGIRTLGGQGPVAPAAPAADVPSVPPQPTWLAEQLEVPEAPEEPEAPQPPALPGQCMVLLGDGGTWLGVRLSDVTAEKARELKLPAEDGAVVIEIEPGSPAAKAGLEKNDLILQFAAERVHSVAQLQRLVRETPPDRTVALQVSRAGQTRTLSAKLEGCWGHERMPHVLFPGMHGPGSDVFYFLHGRETLGITGEELTPQLAGYFGVKQGKGVLVSEVKTGSAAEKAGLKAGDVIVEVDGKQVASVSELRDALPQNLEREKKVSLGVVRDRKEQTVAVEIEPRGGGTLRRAGKIEIPEMDIQIPEVHIEIPEVDLGEIKRLAAEVQQRAGPIQEQIRQMMEQKQCWQREAARALGQQKQAWQEAQRKLREELKDDLGVKQLEGGEGTI